MKEKTQSIQRNFYGRRRGKSLNQAQRRYLSEDLPRLSIPSGTLSSAEGLEAHFGTKRLWLEIGFGSGEHLVHQAVQNPDIGILGAEPYVNGVASCLGRIARQGLANVRILMGDARDLIDRLPPDILERCFLLYPDPWPKTRHHRRRFVTRENLVPLARAMMPGGEFRIATDIGDYVRQALEEVPRSGFSLVMRNGKDFSLGWSDWLSTRYEKKALREGRRPYYLTFERTAGDNPG